MLNGLLSRLQSVAQAHPEWAAYDLLTYLLAGLHLIIENDRLTGGHTEEQIVDELLTLVRAEHPADEPSVHRAIAEAVVDTLTNARNRRLRLRDQYMHLHNDVVEHREQSFAFVRAVGDEDAVEPTLRATPEAVNVFQNLYDFDPSDRAAAERYRSTRMLERAEYDEVLTSVERRATTVHGLRSQLEALVRRISYNVRDVDYAGDVIPKLDEVLETVTEQVNAEERFAEAVADLTHHAAPDLPRLQRIAGTLRGLVGALGHLQSVALTTRRAFEAEQDRQLFTYRRITINPQAQLLEPLLQAPSRAILEMLVPLLATWLGPRTPRVLHLGQLVARCTPGDRTNRAVNPDDPFDLGPRRAGGDDSSEALIAAVRALLSRVVRPTRLSELIGQMTDGTNDGLPWALAVAVANAYGYTGRTTDQPGIVGAFNDEKFLVVSDDRGLASNGGIVGHDLIVVPRHRSEAE